MLNWSGKNIAWFGRHTIVLRRLWCPWFVRVIIVYDIRVKIGSIHHVGRKFVVSSIHSNYVASAAIDFSSWWNSSTDSNCICFGRFLDSVLSMFWRKLRFVKEFLNFTCYLIRLPFYAVYTLFCCFIQNRSFDSPYWLFQGCLLGLFQLLTRQKNFLVAISFGK